MELLALINPENVTDLEVNNYPVREAARAVVIDDENKVALLHVSRDQYYKLPGGGVEGTEDRAAALKRECLEEIGCEIEVMGEVGMIIEYRKFYTLQQISYCYFAKLKGDKGKPNFMPDELEEGFEVIWVPYDEAVALMSKNDAIGLEGQSYIVPRDEILLKAAKIFVTKKDSSYKR